MRVTDTMNDAALSIALKRLSKYLYEYYDRKVIILLDEYDTPMQEAYVCSYWDEMAALTRGLFNSAFKSNPYLERGLMTGIIRISKESIFSDLNNLKVITTTSDRYATSFGFTENEVFENEYLRSILEETVSFYDAGTRASRYKQPENFYHGLVLGLITGLRKIYKITSNRESGFGRYDVVLEPRSPKQDDAVILEFKIAEPEKEKSLEDTVRAALEQIIDKKYAADLMAGGIVRGSIRMYGFAFSGKEVLVDGGYIAEYDIHSN